MSKFFCRLGLHIWSEFIGETFRHEARLCMDCNRIETKVSETRWKRNRALKDRQDVLEYCIGKLPQRKKVGLTLCK